MAEVLENLPQLEHPDLLVGFNTGDDAGVFRLSEKEALRAAGVFGQCIGRVEQPGDYPLVVK